MKNVNINRALVAKKKIFFFVAAAMTALNMAAQPPADSSSKYPLGATKKYTGGTNTLTEDVTCSTSYYNAVQVTGGRRECGDCHQRRNDRD